MMNNSKQREKQFSPLKNFLMELCIFTACKMNAMSEVLIDDIDIMKNIIDMINDSHESKHAIKKKECLEKRSSLRSENRLNFFVVQSTNKIAPQSGKHFNLAFILVLLLSIDKITIGTHSIAHLLYCQFSTVQQIKRERASGQTLILNGFTDILLHNVLSEIHRART